MTGTFRADQLRNGRLDVGRAVDDEVEVELLRQLQRVADVDRGVGLDARRDLAAQQLA